ncbi:MAG: hydrogenase expression/formation protein HypE [Thermoanaerobaculales bacterium]|jgi:hydrogenase expression/formation protein HypE|nr:hydrogenase expression/formation protein HypE [Thermoanaerobaculales bacterium]
MKAPDRVLLAHGGGGRLTRKLVEGLFLPALDNPYLATLTDSAVLPGLPPGRPALTTDAFVVEPPVFAGGDLGCLSIYGTVNDLAMAGARPLWLTFALILEEGTDGELLETCVRGAARAAEEAGVLVVAGDTKVVPRGKADRLFAVTAGLGVVPPGRELGDGLIRPGDALLVSGPIGDHGATVLAHRHALEAPGLRSDCGPLAGLVEALLESGAAVRSLHDPTRGGVVTVCHEVAARSGLRVVLEEEALPVRREVAAVCDLLGLEPLALACEGRALAWVAEADAERAVAAMRAHPAGAGAVVIGRMVEAPAGAPPVIMRTRIGGERPLDLLTGIDLPRIC